jgi:hypothetical protein
VTYPSYLPYFPRAWRHNHALVNASVALHVGTALATIPQVISLLWLHDRVDAYLEGTITRDQLTDATNRYFLIASLPGLVAVANTIVLIVLLWRLARNHQAIGRPNTTFGPVWAIVGVLVPFLSMAVPWLQINEQWKGCDPEHPPTSPQWKSARGSNMVYVWWGVALTAVIIGLAATAGVARAMFSSIGSISRRGDLVEVAQDLVDNNLKWFVASTLLTGVAAILGAVTLRTLVARQDNYAERFHLDHATTTPSYLGSPVSPHAPEPGWFPDPAGRFDHRWWDGTRWTETVSRGGSTMTDPIWSDQ